MACLCDPSLGRASLDHADVGPVSRKVRQRRLSVRQLADRPISRCSPWERCGLGLRRGETFIAFVVVVVAVIGPPADGGHGHGVTRHVTSKRGYYGFFALIAGHSMSCPAPVVPTRWAGTCRLIQYFNPVLDVPADPRRHDGLLHLNIEAMLDLLPSPGSIGAFQSGSHLICRSLHSVAAHAADCCKG